MDRLSQSAFGEHVGLSQAAVSKLVSAGTIDLAEGLDASRVRYCAHLREVAAGRLGSGELDLVAERAALAREQREKLAMQNAQTRRELMPMWMLEQTLGQVGVRVRGILEGLPGSIRRRMSGVSSMTLTIVQQEVSKALNECAAIKFDELKLQEPKGNSDAGQQPE